MKVSASLELSVVALEQPDELTVLLEMAAPDGDHVAIRAPATPQIGLDRSGSMRRRRLDGAKTALLGVVDRLAATDNFGVVAFDKSRTRGGRRTVGTWVDDANDEPAASCVLAYWQLRRLSRELPPVARHLPANGAGVTARRMLAGAELRP